MGGWCSLYGSRLNAVGVSRRRRGGRAQDWNFMELMGRRGAMVTVLAAKTAMSCVPSAERLSSTASLWRHDLPPIRVATHCPPREAAGTYAANCSTCCGGAVLAGLTPSRSADRRGETARRRGRVPGRGTRPDIGDIQCPLVRCVASTSVADAASYISAPTCKSGVPALG